MHRHCNHSSIFLFSCTSHITFRPHPRHPAAQEEDEDVERNITCSASAESHSLAGEGEADSSSHQQPLSSAGDEGDEGSCELSDEVSRDSTMGSDSDTFSSPFCLSPVSEALCESSGSVFLDSESRSVRGLRQTASQLFLRFENAYILPASCAFSHCCSKTS